MPNTERKIIRQLKREHKPLLKAYNKAFNPKPKLYRRIMYKLGVVPLKDYEFVKGALNTIATDEAGDLRLHGNELREQPHDVLVAIAKDSLYAAHKRELG